MDMGSIAAAVTSLKTATDIAKGLMDLKGTAEIQGKVIELQGVILAAQSSALAAQSDQFTLLEEVRNLKAEMAQLEAWNAEKQKYELKRVYPGAYAYVLKPDAQASEPPHWLCAACYQNHKKSILQDHAEMNRDHYYRCPTCQSVIRVGWKTRPDQPYEGA